MANNKKIESLTEQQLALSKRISDLIIGRVLKKAYLDFDEKLKNIKPTGKVEINLKKIFKEEAKNIEKEIKLEIEK